MALLTATNLVATLGGHSILDGVSLTIENAQRVGIVGRNGAGKTTLLRALYGDLKPDEGTVSLARTARVGVLDQHPTFSPGVTVKEAAMEAFDEIRDLQAQLETCFDQMADASDDEQALAKLMDRQVHLEKRIDAMGGLAFEHRIGKVLHGLGFPDDRFTQDVTTLSGGQRARLALAQLLLREPDLIFLDEPTNHLDLTGREWLENFIADEFHGAVVMISHDRYLLDRAVDRIIEVEFARLYEYPGAYTAFRQLRMERRTAQRRAYDKQQTRFKQEEAFIRKFKAGQRAKQARGRESRLERAKSGAIERPLELDSLRLELPKAPRSGDIVLSLRNGQMTFSRESDQSELTLFRDLDLTISRGERWGVIGPNGAGKSTLVRAMLGRSDLTAGESRVGANVMTGYFEQDPAGLDLDQPVYRFLQQRIKHENPELSTTEQQARDLAGAFLFSGNDQEKHLNEMSGGELARARLASLLASAKNLLVLDEPTNHLDIPSAERLEHALRPKDQGGAFDGTLIIISHDRALIDAACDNLIIFDGAGGVTTHLGNYSSWARKRDEAAADTHPQPVKPAKKPTTAAKHTNDSPARTASKPASQVKSALSWMPLDRLEKEIESLQKQIPELDAELAKEHVYRDAGATRKVLDERADVAADLERHEDEWLRRMDDA